MTNFEFHGKAWDYFKIWIVNIVLTIITLGLYYPWAKVRKRRYLYSNSSFQGRTFDYHATGKQLFFSHLLAIALFVAYIGLSYVHPLASGALTLLFAVIFPWILWRSTQFNARMTSFSNVRFSFAGALKGAYIIFLLYPMIMFALTMGLFFLIGALVVKLETEGTLVMLELGVLVVALVALMLFGNAFITAKISEYIINGYRYGQGQFAALLRPGFFIGVYLRSLLIWVLFSIVLSAVLGVVILLAGGFEMLQNLQAHLNNPEQWIEQNIMLVASLFTTVYLTYFLIGAAVFAFIEARVRRYVFAETTFNGDTKFESALKARTLLWLWTTNFLIILHTFGLGIPWAKVRTLRTKLSNTSMETSSDLDSYVTQQQAEQSSLAEQIGDVFDADLGLGI